MRRLIVTEWMTLDGVVQAPTRPDEDPDGGFEHGGWHARHFGDAMYQEWVVEGIVGADAFLFGRRTWETFAAYWPHAPEAEQVVARPLNEKPKHVATTTLAGPLDAWPNSTPLEGDAAEAVGALKSHGDGVLLAIGSAELVRTLVERGLVDGYRLMIDPVLVGGGKRIFRDDGVLRELRLVDGRVTSTGAFLATYETSPGPASDGSG